MHLPPADRNFLTCDAGHVAGQLGVAVRQVRLDGGLTKNSCWLICRLECPSATSCHNSISRRLSAASGARIRSISCSAMAGASADFPAAAVRTAVASSSGGASLSG